MKILLVNNFYYNRGGDCTYLFSLRDLLIKRGHDVIIFSMHHPQNYDSEYSKYFVSYINYDEVLKTKTLSWALRVANRTVYSQESKKKIENLIKVEKPDIAHVQNIHHHVTPSIFPVLNKYNIPILWTLHDYSVICPNTSFLSQGKPCEKCRKKRYFWPILVRCKKNSFAASTMAAMEATVHLMMGAYKFVDFFIAPSKFLHNKLIQYGAKKDKLIHLNNFTCFTDSYGEPQYTETYFVYLGRLSGEKGVKTLIDAVVLLFKNDKFNSWKLKIIGDGPLKGDMMSYAELNSIQDKIEFLGHRSPDEAMKILKGSKFLVLPSEWYENLPYSILESFLMGKPVIASRMGGIPELVKNWETGLLFESGNSEMLALKIGFLLKHPEKAEAMGKAAREFMTGEINLENHYLKLMDIYKHAIKMKASNKQMKSLV